MYIYERKGWPNFQWDQLKIAEHLAPIRYRAGRLIGKMESLGFSLQSEAVLQTMIVEALKTSEIEGEFLDKEQVRSSIARQLGMDVSGLIASDRNVDGLVEILIDATKNYKSRLTKERLFSWHAALFPTGRNGLKKIRVGQWRTNDKEPMQVVSGAVGREKIHFEAPISKDVPKEMLLFLKWFNTENETDPVIKAAIAHLWFLTIHPFEDGNGRLARTIADLQLSRADGISQRFYGMSAQIRLERKSYYNALEKTQKGSLDISDWIEWFLLCYDKSLTSAEITLAGVIRKARYWEFLGTKILNERQKLLLNKLLDKFEGKLNTSKWAKIAKCSQDTALRDIQNLVEQGVLLKNESGGRSTSYLLKELE